MTTESRREVAARKISIFMRLAKSLVSFGITPNQVSIASSVFAIIAAISICSHTDDRVQAMTLLGLAIFGIQMRLVCNLVDGLMAVEGGLKTASGELFNDVPDRISDAVILIACGYAARLGSPWGLELGWTAALFAIWTAYVRTLGASMTGKHDFAGPMAKQHRMFLVTMACIGSGFEAFGFWSPGVSMFTVLMLIAIGSLVTCVNRLRRTYQALEKK